MRGIDGWRGWVTAHGYPTCGGAVPFGVALPVIKGEALRPSPWCRTVRPQTENGGEISPPRRTPRRHFRLLTARLCGQPLALFSLFSNQTASQSAAMPAAAETRFRHEASGTHARVRPPTTFQAAARKSKKRGRK